MGRSCYSLGSSPETGCVSRRPLPMTTRDSSASTEAISASTEQSSASEQEIAASAQQLSSNAETLNELVAHSKVLDG
jgi:hypothetical protein